MKSNHLPRQLCCVGAEWLFCSGGWASKRSDCQPDRRGPVFLYRRFTAALEWRGVAAACRHLAGFGTSRAEMESRFPTTDRCVGAESAPWKPEPIHLRLATDGLPGVESVALAPLLKRKSVNQWGFFFFASAPSMICSVFFCEVIRKIEWNLRSVLFVSSGRATTCLIACLIKVPPGFLGCFWHCCLNIHKVILTSREFGLTSMTKKCQKQKHIHIQNHNFDVRWSWAYLISS